MDYKEIEAYRKDVDILTQTHIELCYRSSGLV
jgi:hypothetical protein